jgi:hypothetical protein
MTYNSSSLHAFRGTMFALASTHPVKTVGALRAGIDSIAQANPPADDLAIETTHLGA